MLCECTFLYLVCQFVSDDHGHPLLAGGRVGLFVIEQRSLAVGDQPPVLHGPSREVRDGKQVCKRTQGAGNGSYMCSSGNFRRLNVSSYMYNVYNSMLYKIFYCSIKPYIPCLGRG